MKAGRQAVIPEQGNERGLGQGDNERVVYFYNFFKHVCSHSNLLLLRFSWSYRPPKKTGLLRIGIVTRM